MLSIHLCFSPSDIQYIVVSDNGFMLTRKYDNESDLIADVIEIVHSHFDLAKMVDYGC